MNTPILLIAWRRPQALRKVIDAIRPIAPKLLFVACDGPKFLSGNEKEKVIATRMVIEQEIDWRCQVECLYSDENQGCRIGVSSAITWFFQHIEEGIILEDDCVPHQDFFIYCEELLSRYRYDTRLWSVCGSNFQLGRKRGNASYYFSIHGDSWGWATWRRAWQAYPDAANQWFDFRDSGRLNDVFLIPEERNYWLDTLNELFINNNPSSWAYQWWLASWMNNGLHAWPNSCLVSNIGFNSDATHTLAPNNFSNLKLHGLGTIRHPKFILPDRDADQFSFLHRRSGLELIERRTYGLAYPLLSRYRSIKAQGISNYLNSKLNKFFKKETF